MLLREERRRYSRQLILPDFGELGQERLKNASVLVIGAGGLGCPVMIYLAAAGIGRIGIVDDDLVDVSNLHRQILYTPEDVGRSKAEVSATKLSLQNPHVKIESHQSRLTSENAMELIDAYDIVVDGSDNFPTRYLVNDACVLLSKVLIYGAIHQYEGQVSVFNYLHEDGTRGPNYRDLFPQPPQPNQVPNCAEAGVLGVLPGIIGTLQANETIKAILNSEDVLSGKLLIFDARAASSMKININKTVSNPLNGNHPTIFELIDYEIFCGIPHGQIGLITKRELLEWKASKKEVITIDVRERTEIIADPFEAIHIPMSAFADRMDEVPSNQIIVFACRSGNRSAQAIQLLMASGRIGEWYSLEGGV